MGAGTRGVALPKGKKNRRLRLAESQNWRCAYCSGLMDMDGTRLDGATIEHIVPRIHGGARDPENLVAACLACNNARSGFYSARIFYKVRRWQLRKGAWPCCTFPTAKVRKRVLRIFTEAEAVQLTKLATAPNGPIRPAACSSDPGDAVRRETVAA